MVKKSFIDHPTVSSIVFYPRKSSIPTMLSPNIKILKLEVSKRITIGGFFYVNDFNLPTILLFHGNGELDCRLSIFFRFFF